MKLPNAECTVVEREKIADYLFNAAHPDNGGKAAFFLALGFRQEEWQTLAAAFRRLAEKFDIELIASNPLDACVDAENPLPVLQHDHGRYSP